jgi:hypothetical protein
VQIRVTARCRSGAAEARCAHASEEGAEEQTWFLNDDGTECEVREGYVDADALIEHAQHVFETREKLFRDFAYDHNMTIYGEPSPALAELMEQLAPVVPFRRFSLLQGLDVDIEARREVLA